MLWSIVEEILVNDVFFGCRTCKIYQDAGYRWCYLTLEDPGIVERGKPLAVNTVLNASDYWQGAREEVWLQRLLPQVHTFIKLHEMHDLIYGDAEGIGIVPMTDNDYGFLDWMSADADDTSDLLPRYFVEKLGYVSWQQVTMHIARLESKPWWWHDSEVRQKAEEKFISLLAH